MVLQLLPHPTKQALMHRVQQGRDWIWNQVAIANHKRSCNTPGQVAGFTRCSEINALLHEKRLDSLSYSWIQRRRISSPGETCSTTLQIGRCSWRHRPIEATATLQPQIDPSAQNSSPIRDILKVQSLQPIPDRQRNVQLTYLLESRKLHINKTSSESANTGKIR